MAADEYASVSSKSDTEQSAAELVELTQDLCRSRRRAGLARQVAAQMTVKDAFAAHTRDELRLADHALARRVQVALASAATFAVGATIPLAIAVTVPAASISWAVSGGSLICLALLGALGARIGGADMVKPTIRVTFWGAFVMAATWGIGALVGHAV